MILQIKIEEAQNKFAIVSIVSFQIEVICIFSKRGVYKLIFEDFIHSNCFFVTISLLRGYFYKIMCNGQQAELNFNLLKPTKMEPLEVLVVLEASKYGFYILRSQAAISQTFIREPLFTFSCLDFPQTVIYLYNSFPSGFCDTGISAGSPCSYVPCIWRWFVQNRCLSSALYRKVFPFSVP